MRGILVIIGLLLTLNASAETAMPATTLKPATGTVDVGGTVVNYSVTDKGWLVNGEVIPNYHMVYSRKFLIDYETKVQVDEKALNAVAEAACKELADQSFVEISPLPEVNLVLSFKSESRYSTPAAEYMGYACHVQVDETLI